MTTGLPLIVELEELASRWVEMAFRQSDMQIPRADGAAAGLRTCALMLRELLGRLGREGAG